MEEFEEMKPYSRHFTLTKYSCPEFENRNAETETITFLKADTPKTYLEDSKPIEKDSDKTGEFKGESSSPKPIVSDTDSCANKNELPIAIRNTAESNKNQLSATVSKIWKVENYNRSSCVKLVSAVVSDINGFANKTVMPTTAVQKPEESKKCQLSTIVNKMSKTYECKRNHYSRTLIISDMDFYADKIVPITCCRKSEESRQSQFPTTECITRSTSEKKSTPVKQNIPREELSTDKKALQTTIKKPKDSNDNQVSAIAIEKSETVDGKKIGGSTKLIISEMAIYRKGIHKKTSLVENTERTSKENSPSNSAKNDSTQDLICLNKKSENDEENSLFQSETLPKWEHIEKNDDHHEITNKLDDPKSEIVKLIRATPSVLPYRSIRIDSSPDSNTKHCDQANCKLTGRHENCQIEEKGETDDKSTNESPDMKVGEITQSKDASSTDDSLIEEKLPGPSISVDNEEKDSVKAQSMEPATEKAVPPPPKFKRTDPELARSLRFMTEIYPNRKELDDVLQQAEYDIPVKNIRTTDKFYKALIVINDGEDKPLDEIPSTSSSSEEDKPELKKSKITKCFQFFKFRLGSKKSSGWRLPST